MSNSTTIVVNGSDHSNLYDAEKVAARLQNQSLPQKVFTENIFPFSWECLKNEKIQSTLHTIYLFIYYYNYCYYIVVVVVKMF